MGTNIVKEIEPNEWPQTHDYCFRLSPAAGGSDAKAVLNKD